MRRKAVLFLALCMTILLCGCSLKSGDELYTLPEMSVEYESLRNNIQRLLDSGLEYAAPVSGSNTQPVQEVDLNNDGIGEVVAYFKDSSASEASLQVHIFAQNEDGEYEPMTVINGQGSAVNSVTYAQLADDPYREIVLTWQMSAGVYSLSVYSIWQGGNELLMEPKNYTRNVVSDLNGDGISELILLQLDPTDMSSSRAELYAYSNGAMALGSEAQLSADLATIERMRSSKLYGGENAIYVTGYVSDPDSGGISSNVQLTDILTLKDGNLVNVTRSEQSGSSTTTRRRTYVADQDINGDGIWEVPVLTSLYERLPGGQVVMSETFYLISWIQYDLDGGRHTQSVTYYNSSDGWYLTVPESWNNQIAAARSDYNEGSTVERSICFYTLEKILPGEGSNLQLDETLGLAVLSNTKAVPLLTIYKNSGSDQYSRARQEGRTVLETGDQQATYSVALFDNEWSEWTAEDVQENLHIIVTNWSSD